MYLQYIQHLYVYVKRRKDSLSTFCISIPLHIVSSEPRSPKRRALKLPRVTGLLYKAVSPQVFSLLMGKTECVLDQDVVLFFGTLKSFIYLYL